MAKKLRYGNTGFWGILYYPHFHNWESSHNGHVIMILFPSSTSHPGIRMAVGRDGNCFNLLSIWGLRRISSSPFYKAMLRSANPQRMSLVGVKMEIIRLNKDTRNCPLTHQQLEAYGKGFDNRIVSPR